MPIDSHINQAFLSFIVSCALCQYYWVVCWPQFSFLTTNYCVNCNYQSLFGANPLLSTCLHFFTAIFSSIQAIYVFAYYVWLFQCLLVSESQVLRLYLDSSYDRNQFQIALDSAQTSNLKSSVALFSNCILFCLSLDDLNCGSKLVNLILNLINVCQLHCVRHNCANGWLRKHSSEKWRLLRQKCQECY